MTLQKKYKYIFALLIFFLISCSMIYFLTSEKMDVYKFHPQSVTNEIGELDPEIFSTSENTLNFLTHNYSELASYPSLITNEDVHITVGSVFDDQNYLRSLRLFVFYEVEDSKNVIYEIAHHLDPHHYQMYTDCTYEIRNGNILPQKIILSGSRLENESVFSAFGWLVNSKTSTEPTENLVIVDLFTTDSQIAQKEDIPYILENMEFRKIY